MTTPLSGQGYGQSLAVGDHFGRTLTLTGDQLLVGSTILQAVYVFEKDGSGEWSETQILTANDNVPGNFIGRISAADGDSFLTASWANSDGRGAVYVFDRDPSTGLWSETAKLMGSDVLPNDLFGMSIAVEDDLALIGTAQQANSTGAVYVFTRDPAAGSWSEQTKLTGPEIAPNSRFGAAVGLEDGVALVAASTHEIGVGVVFEFSYDEATGAWQTGATLRPFDGGNPGTQFGAAMQFGSDEAWFGAPGAADFGGNVDQTRTLIWDITDLDDPILAREYFADNESSDHNLYIRGDVMYQSNYVSGLRILDISDRENPEVVGFFDTVPGTLDRPGFDGSWSNHPFFESGIVLFCNILGDRLQIQTGNVLKIPRVERPELRTPNDGGGRMKKQGSPRCGLPQVA